MSDQPHDGDQETATSHRVRVELARRNTLNHRGGATSRPPDADIAAALGGAVLCDGDARSHHGRHELRGHQHEGSHHVAVFVFEDVAVIHVAAAVTVEADGDLDDLVGGDADGVLQA